MSALVTHDDEDIARVIGPKMHADQSELRSHPVVESGRADAAHHVPALQPMESSTEVCPVMGRQDYLVILVNQLTDYGGMKRLIEVAEEHVALWPRRQDQREQIGAPGD